MVRLTDSLDMTIAVDWDAKPQTKQTKRERIGSVVECLTRDQGVAGLSLTASLLCVLEQDKLILA